MSTPPLRSTNAKQSEEERTQPVSHRPQNAEQSVEESISRDLQDPDVSDTLEEDDGDHDIAARGQPPQGDHTLAGNPRRSSYIASGPRPFLGLAPLETAISTEQERETAINEERSLLEDNNLIPSKHAERRESTVSSKGLRSRISISGFSNSRRKHRIQDEEATVPDSETTALLPNHSSSHNDDASTTDEEDTAETIKQKWEDAILTGTIQTSWQRETKVIAKYSGPLIITFILQNSLTLTSIFTVGHIGRNELGAVSIGGMTATITGYAVYHGLATSLDTLCAQAYGSGKKKLVGLNLQRMVLFLWTITVPIAIVWIFGTQILRKLVPEEEIAILGGQYLKVLILGAPGYAAFESGKRYVQAQGNFAATLYVLLIAAPANVIMHYLFVWRFGWGFIGCPIAVVITENLMPLLLALYGRFIGGMECWPGLSRAAFRNWGPMIRLALPGFVMVIAEFLAFEILTLASANFSATHLAANTILQSLSVLTYNLPFPVSIAGSTRVANLIGATLPEAAKMTTRVMFVIGGLVGIFNMVMLSSFKEYIPYAFTQDADVIELAARTLPVNAAFQLSDALAAQCNGALRGLGKQSVGGILCLVAFYCVALPISFGAGFGLHWKLFGLWLGPAIGLFVQSVTEGLFIYKTSWAKASEEASRRNAAG